MADTTSLTSFLNDVASAIKSKTGDSTAIPASQFDTKIRSIPTGGTYETINRTITDNGNITLLPSQGYDAIEQANLTIQVSGGGEVKKFDSQQSMQADPTAELGDLAVVYGNHLSTWTENTHGSKFIFSNSTVTLSTAVTENVYPYFRSEGSGYISIDVRLTPTQFRCQFYGSGGNKTITYTSADGITYTTTSTVPFEMDFGENVYCMDDWNNALSSFIQTGGYEFEGLYEYENTDGDIITLGLNLNDKINSSTNTYVYGSKSDLISKIPNESKHILATYSYVKTFEGYDIYTVSKAYLGQIWSSGSNAGFCLAYKNSKYYLAIYSSVSSDFTCKKYENGEITTVTITPTTESGITGVTLIEEINLSQWAGGYVPYYYDESKSSFGLYQFNYPSGSSNYTLSATNSPNYNHYTIAPSQLNLIKSNELLPNKIALGKKGVVTGDGSIYDNLDLSLIYNRFMNFEPSTSIDNIYPTTNIDYTTLYSLTPSSVGDLHTLSYITNNNNKTNLINYDGEIQPRRNNCNFQIVGDYVYQLRRHSSTRALTFIKSNISTNETTVYPLNITVIQGNTYYNIDWAVFDNKLYVMYVESGSGASYLMKLQEYDYTNDTMTLIWSQNVTGSSNGAYTVMPIISIYNNILHFGYANNTNSSYGYTTAYTIKKYQNSTVTNIYSSGTYKAMQGATSETPDGRYMVMGYQGTATDAYILIYDFDTYTHKEIRNSLGGFDTYETMIYQDGTKLFARRYNASDASDYTKRTYLDLSNNTLNTMNTNMASSIYNWNLTKVGNYWLTYSNTTPTPYYKVEIINNVFTMTPMFTYYTIRNTTYGIIGMGFDLVENDTNVYTMKVLPYASQSSPATYNSDIKKVIIVQGTVGKVNPETAQYIFVRPYQTASNAPNAIVIRRPSEDTETVEIAEEQISDLFGEEENE